MDLEEVSPEEAVEVEEASAGKLKPFDLTLRLSEIYLF